jgi:hypothetical protein
MLDELLSEAAEAPAKICPHCFLQMRSPVLNEVAWPIWTVNCPKHNVPLVDPHQIVHDILALKGALIVDEEHPLAFLEDAYSVLARLYREKLGSGEIGDGNDDGSGGKPTGRS